MDLKVGMTVQVNIIGGGVFVGTVERFERDGNMAVIRPNREPVRDVFPRGYSIGRGHWGECIKVL